VRKTKIVQVPPGWGDGFRDTGKTFLLTEMSAAAAEKWAWRMMLALKGTSGHIDPAVQKLGIVGVAIAGLNAFLKAPVKPEEIEPLMDELLNCVTVCRDPHHPEVFTKIVSDDDIQEVRTRLWLRSEVLALHTNFSMGEALWRLISMLQVPN
jgi:hypothetical protein